MQIHSIMIGWGEGASFFYVGGTVFNPDEQVIDQINLSQLHVNGDPFDHYCGYNADGKMIFSVNCLAHCTVVYK